MGAVEWIAEKVRHNPLMSSSDYNKLLEQAKEMEKQQIVDAFFQGVDRESDGHGVMYLSRKDAEQYYNETFKSK